MAYVKQIWEDRVVEKPMTFNQQLNTDGTLTLTPSPGLVTSEGTKVTAERMNHIEDGIANLAGIEIITGEITCTKEADSTQVIGSALFDYPEGFDMNNAIILSVLTKSQTLTTAGYSYGTVVSVIDGLMLGNIEKRVIPISSGLRLNMWHNIGSGSQEQETFKYDVKIVLMKSN